MEQFLLQKTLHGWCTQFNVKSCTIQWHWITGIIIWYKFFSLKSAWNFRAVSLVHLCSLNSKLVHHLYEDSWIRNKKPQHILSLWTRKKWNLFKTKELVHAEEECLWEKTKDNKPTEWLDNATCFWYINFTRCYGWHCAVNLLFKLSITVLVSAIKDFLSHNST